MGHPVIGASGEQRAEPGYFAVPVRNEDRERSTAEHRHSPMCACYHFSVAIADTSPTAQAVQLRIHRAMSGEQRILLAYEMSMFGRELNRERLRREHPEWPEARISRELLRLAFLPAPLPAGLQ